MLVWFILDLMDFNWILFVWNSNSDLNCNYV
jgi:hypothetical protein